jgi:acetylornithine deacetylase
VIAPAAALGRPTELLSSLVAIPSPSGAEEQSADAIEELMRAAGLDVERVGASVLGVLDRGGPRVLFNTHHDTVPIGEGWHGDPYDAAWRGAGAERRLVARGANDAKASVAAMLCAAAAHARVARAPNDRGTLLFGVTACEETTNAGMTALLARLAERGLAPDGGVTGEPTGLAVVRAQSGLAVLEARWTGRACHAAHVARVAHANALLAAVRELAHLPEWFALEGEHPLLGPSTLVATVLTAGERHNAVPDLATAVFDARLAPPHDAAECAALLRAHLPGADVRVKSDRLRPIETAADHPLVAAALAATGRAPAIGSATMSDMALLAGIPAVKCGPGETARSHTANEFVLAHELEAGVAAYSALIPAALEALA